jgi:hypothetical protein
VRLIDGGDERPERRYMETHGAILAWDYPIVGANRLRAPSGFCSAHRADPVIDTSLLTAADLKLPLTGCFALDAARTARFCPVLRLSPRHPARC